MENADILLMDKDIGKLPLAVKAARYTAAVVKVNTAVAAALKLLPDEKRRQDVVSAQHRDFDGLAAERIAEAVLARCGK